MRSATLLPLAAVLAACGGSSSSHQDPQPQPFCPAGVLATFSSIDQKVLKVRCTACHAGALARGGLDLSGSAYGQLVGVAAQNVAATSPPAGLLRVKPGDASGSLLWQKLVIGSFSAQYGAGMPQDAPGTVCPAVADQVQAWINAGAANN